MRASSFILIIPFILLFSHCEEEKKQREVPDNVLDEERFTMVLTELYLLEAEAKYRKTNFKEDPDSILPLRSHRIFEEHNTDRESFRRSFCFYTQNPDRMEAIHEEVLNELMRREKN